MSIYDIYLNGFTKQMKEDKIDVFKRELERTTPKHLLFILTLSKTVFPPKECAEFLRQCIDFSSSKCPDIGLYKRCVEIYKEIGQKLDIQELIEQLPNEDVVSRGLIVSICPVPLDPAYVNFIFETATSQYALNRIQFLKYLERLIDSEVPQQYNRLINGILEILSNDPCPLVKAAWVKPALHFLKENSHLRGFLKRMSDPNEAQEVKIALALNFKEACEVTKQNVIRLLSTNDNKVLAALIPQLADIPEINLLEMAPIYKNTDTTIRVFILRYLGKLKQEHLEMYISENSDELNNELLRYLCNYEEPLPFVVRIIHNVKSKEKAKQFNWRTNYEIMRIPINILLEIGEEAFEIAEKCIFRHPNILMKQAVYVLSYFSLRKADYQKKINRIIAKLASDTDNEYSQLALNLLNFAIQKVQTET